MALSRIVVLEKVSTTQRTWQHAVPLRHCIRSVLGGSVGVRVPIFNRC